MEYRKLGNSGLKVSVLSYGPEYKYIFIYKINFISLKYNLFYKLEIY